MFLQAICIAALAVIAPSCGGDDEAPAPAATVSVNPAAVSFGADGGSAIVSVSASAEWEAVSSDSWLTVATLKDAVEITAKPNTLTSQRAGTVRVVCGASRAIINVSQQGAELQPEDPTIPAPEGYQLVWHDEFSGSELDASAWRHEVKSPGWVNNELQYYVNGSADGKPVTSVADGKLTITAFLSGGKVYSGRIYAGEHTGWTYGIFEARIKLPKGRGTWPAFWMMPVDNDFSANPWPRCGEIDIMEEVGYHPNYTSSSIHCESYNHVMGTQKTAERFTSGAEDEYHVYRLEWTPDAIITYVDDNRLLYFPNDGAGNVSTWPFNRPFYIILNLAWGGSWGGQQGVDESRLPAEYQIDYVRVFQKK